MDKSEFIDRLVLAANAARDFAKKLHQVDAELPERMAFTLHFFPAPDEQAEKGGPIKFLGGRLLNSDELIGVPASRAGALLWVDGKVPEWVNICLTGYSSTASEFELYFSKLLLPANEKELPPDAGTERGNRLVPFRIRGPGNDSWVKR